MSKSQENYPYLLQGVDQDQGSVKWILKSLRITVWNHGFLHPEQDVDLELFVIVQHICSKVIIAHCFTFQMHYQGQVKSIWIFAKVNMS